MLLKKLVVVILFFESAAMAAPSLPFSMRTGSSRFLNRSLGSACYTLDSVERGLPCNPAAIAKERDRQFDMDVMMGSQMQALQDAKGILDQTASAQQISQFFSRREAIEAEGSVEASYQTPTWGIAVEPVRYLAVTRFQNPSLPYIDATLSQEQSIRTQVGTYAGDNFYAGLQLRYTHAKFISRSFFLTEALSGDKDSLWKPQTQDLMYLEPGFLYSWEEVPWRPQVSAVLANWGWSSEKSDAYPIQPEGLLGASIKPFVPFGDLELGLQFQVYSGTQNAREAFRAALNYQLGILSLLLAAGDTDRSAGFVVRYESFSTGLTYWDQSESRGVFISFMVSL